LSLAPGHQASGEICCSLDPQCRRPAGRMAVASGVPGWQTSVMPVFEFPNTQPIAWINSYHAIPDSLS
jgi:hypothetical protein